MKPTLIITSILYLFLFSVYGQEANRSAKLQGYQQASKSLEDKLIDIKEKYGAITYALPYYKKSSGELNIETVEPCGYSYTAYKRDGNLRKLVIEEVCGDGGPTWLRNIREYYYWDNSLFFVFLSA